MRVVFAQAGGWTSAQRDRLSQSGTFLPVLRADGKVTKGPFYSPPDIAGELRKQGWDPAAELTAEAQRLGMYEKKEK
jgi:hypothetical protein